MNNLLHYVIDLQKW